MKKTESLNIRLDNKTHLKLKHLAEDTGRNISSLARIAIAELLKNPDIIKKPPYLNITSE